MSGFDLGDLADLVACPECHANLVVTAESLVCTRGECRLSFPVREQIPVLLVEEAESLEESTWRAVVGDAPGESEKPGDDGTLGEEEAGNGEENES